MTAGTSTPLRHQLTPLEKSERRLGYLMIAPAFALLAAVVVHPIVQLVTGSFYFNHLAQS